MRLPCIYKQAGIRWNLESVVDEPANKTDTYAQDIAYIAATKRDVFGKSDPTRLPLLYSLMNPQHLALNKLDQNLYHIYLFPFIGNTSQGNAMSKYGYHSVVGVWTNKHNKGATPEPRLLVENWNAYKRGSLSRTIAHELGHVLQLRHKKCTAN